MPKPRLLVLTTTYPRWEGDTEPPFVHELCRRLDAFEVHVIAPHAPGAASEETLHGVQVHRFRYAPGRLESLAYNGGIAANLRRSKWKYLLLQGFLLGMFFRALQVARAHDIHLFHAHWLVPVGLIGATLRELLPGDNRLLLTAHGGDVVGLRGGLFATLRRWVTGEADHVTVVSQALAQIGRAEQWPDTPVSVAPMGTDLRQVFVPPAGVPDTPTLVFAGRLVPKKGVQQLIEALPEVLARAPECRVLIAGHGPLQAPLERRVHELGLDDRVRFTGRYRLDELPAILQQGSLAVLPFVIGEDGDTEGLGLTLVEAMGCGLPVISGDVPAVHDVIEDGANGLLVDATDTRALAAAISGLLEDPARARRLAECGRERALARFDWSGAAQAYQRILLGLAES